MTSFLLLLMLLHGAAGSSDWIPRPDLSFVPSDLQTNDRFCFAVTVRGTTAIVSAATKNKVGAFYEFQYSKDGDQWLQQGDSVAPLAR